jgi:hypothetical protein
MKFTEPQFKVLFLDKGTTNWAAVLKKQGK